MKLLYTDLSTNLSKKIENLINKLDKLCCCYEARIKRFQTLSKKRKNEKRAKKNKVQSLE